MIDATTIFLPKVATNNWMDQISQSLGISGDPQGFFLYLLIMVGIFVVISILIYNWLEERRFNKQVESNFSTIEEDALLDEKQQQFFDKFASTTGVLNDQPPEGTFIDEDGEAIEDDRSIEDVYAELLETMSKRNRKEKVEPDTVIINEVEVISEPVLEVPSDAVDVSDDKEPSLYIPETAEVTDAEIIEPVITEPPVIEEAAVNLTFGEADTVAMPVDAVETAGVASDADTVSVEAADAQSAEEAAVSEAPAPEENDIKAIINRAFKEKYNPNFKAEQETQSEVLGVTEQVENLEQDGAPENADDVVAEVEETLSEPSPLEDVEAQEETVPALTEQVAEEPPIITESVDTDEAPVLNFPAEEVENEPEASLESEVKTEAPEDDAQALDFLKGLDEPEVPEPDFSEPLMQTDAEPPILDEQISEAQTTPQDEITAATSVPEEPLMQTYQQLLNADKLQEPPADESNAAFAIPKATHDGQPSADASDASKQTSAEESTETASETTPETPASAPVEKQSIFTDALPAHLNPHIDFIGTIEAHKGSNAAFVLESFSTFHKQFEFPVFVFMQSQQSQWLLLNDATELEISRYLERNQPVHITASIQMADRTGPISRNTIQRFKQSLSEIAVTMGATAEWVDPSDPIDRAASLDAFCIEVDKTMFFHLANTKTPFTGIKLKGLVETQGMVLERDGSYKYYDLNTENGVKRSVPDFVLFNRDNHKFTEEMLRTSVIKAVTMQLDIPLIMTSAAALDRMVVIAQSLESSLSAQLVDDKNRQITDVHLARIREQIKSIHAAMQLRGITPGSSHAQRLFS